MKFSVLIPLYNKAKYIRSTLLSALNQTCADLEVLVIDDGSQDEGLAIVEAFNDPRVRVFRQANSGVSRTRNFGISEARGDWIAFLDADDTWHSRYLESIVEAMDALPEIQMIGSAYRYVHDSDPRWSDPTQLERPIPAQDLLVVTDLAERWLEAGSFVCTSSLCVRRELLNRHQPCFAAGERLGEDIDLWFRLNALTPCTWVPMPMVDYRDQATGSLSREAAVGNYVEAPFVTRMEARCIDKSAPAWQRPGLLKFANFSRITLARDALSHGERARALHLLWRSRSSCLSPRWLLSAAMAVALPGTWAARWQSYRLNHTRLS